jgi:hypothetical protein
MQDTTTWGGVDWAQDEHAVCVVNDDATVRAEFTVAHTADGLNDLCGRLRRSNVARVAIERPDGPVVDALMTDGFDVVVVSSRIVQGAAQPLRIGRQQVRPHRRLRPRGLSAHRRPPLAVAAAGHARDHHTANACAGPQRPRRDSRRDCQPAPRTPRGLFSWRDRPVRRSRQLHQLAVLDPIPLHHTSQLAVRETARCVAARQRILRT